VTVADGLDVAGINRALDELAAAAGAPGNAETLRDYWSHGEGAAKIRWGTPGDHERCVKQLVLHGHMTDDQAHGYCNLLEKRTTGLYPAQHAQLEKGHAAAADEVEAGLALIEAARFAGRLHPRAAGPALVTIPGVDILAAGTWELSTGRQTFTADDLNAAVRATGCPAVGDPIIKIGHLDDRFKPGPGQDGEPAIGKVANMRLDASGAKLIGDLAGLPGWLAAPNEEGQSVIGSAFPRRSVEGSYGFTCQIGHTHPFVITALALLGVTPPGVGVLNGLGDIASLYGVTASAQWRTPPTQAAQEGTVMAVSEEDVRRAYYAAEGVPPTWWITELQMSPTQLMVTDGDGRMYRVPFTIAGAGVEFGEPDELAGMADLAASRGTGPVIVFASADDSRAVSAAGWDGAAAVRNLGDAPSKAALAKCFALPGATKSDSKLPHHDVGADGTVGAPNPVACSAAIAAINGAHGGLVGASAGDKKAAYGHLAAHLRELGKEPPPLQAAAAPGLEIDAAGGHGPHGSASEPASHEHAHPAFGSQGGDQTHSHPHSHAGDNDHAHEHAPAAAGRDRKGGSDVEFTTEEDTSLRASLGLGEDSELTPAAIVAAAAGLREQADAKVAAGGRMRLPDTVIAIERSVWEATQKEVEAGRKFREKKTREDRDALIAAAARAGKLPAANIEGWQRAWEKDPDGTKDLLAALPANAVPVNDMGQPGTGYGDDLNSDYERLFGGA
jgi:hypothetical protein